MRIGEIVIAVPRCLTHRADLAQEREMRR